MNKKDTCNHIIGMLSSFDESWLIDFNDLVSYAKSEIQFYKSILVDGEEQWDLLK